MIHFTCDVCGKELRPGQQQRFVIKIEAAPAQAPGELTEEDLDEDNLEAVSQILQESESLELPAARQHFRFDLCCECHRRFLVDPLGKKQNLSLFASEN